MENEIYSLDNIYNLTEHTYYLNRSSIDIHYILNGIESIYILLYTYSNYFNKYTQINNNYYIYLY